MFKFIQKFFKKKYFIVKYNGSEIEINNEKELLEFFDFCNKNNSYKKIEKINEIKRS